MKRIVCVFVVFSRFRACMEEVMALVVRRNRHIL